MNSGRLAPLSSDTNSTGTDRVKTTYDRLGSAHRAAHQAEAAVEVVVPARRHVVGPELRSDVALAAINRVRRHYRLSYWQGHGFSQSPDANVYLRINGHDGAYEVGSWDGTNHSAQYPIPQGDEGNWVHLAGIYDGEQWRLYRNGVLVASSPSGVGPIQMNDNWVIGCCCTGTGYFFDGVVDEVRIYGRALSAEEIEALAG